MKNILRHLIPLSIRKKRGELLEGIKYKPIYKEKTKRILSNVPYGRFVVIGTPNSGNLGDHAIVEAQKRFLKEHFPEKEYVEISINHYKFDYNNIKRMINKRDVIIICGGGFLGNLWPNAELMVRNVLSTFHDNKVIIMPQTINFDERFNKDEELKLSKLSYNSHNNLTLFLREKQSYEFVMSEFSASVNPKLVPDIVTTMEYASKKNTRNDVLMVLRSDKEKMDNSETFDIIYDLLDAQGLSVDFTDTVIKDEVNEYNRVEKLRAKFDEFSNYKLIITDRLHGMIFSLITGTPCIAFDNSSKKVSGVYEWLYEFNYIYCMDNEKKYSKEEINTVIKKLLDNRNSTYESSILSEKFDVLIDDLK
ncbi:polysaccharide pyruvyl transferase family protein [Aerococcus urinaeequi]|uniref:polysaccharide pyruvyl transferase family protein n=1 Tax=Aerococcus urinaeequi TaxID=51665 RepID=UPI003AAE3E3B